MVRTYRFIAASAGLVELLIYDKIGETWFGDGITGKKFRADLAQYAGRDLKVRINSPGGSVFDGLVIYHALKEHAGAGAKVTIMIDGIAASIASVIAMAGTEIVMKQGAMIMIHDPMALMFGNAQELRAEADVLDKMATGMTSIYADRTAQNPPDVRSMMSEETWFSADEAVAEGFADRIENTLDPVPAEDDADEARAAVLASGDPVRLMKLWDLSEVFQNCPDSCAGGAQRLTLKKLKPSARAKSVAQLREFLNITPVDSGTPAQAKQEMNMKTKAELLAALAAETDQTKRLALMRQIAAHKDATDAEKADLQTQIAALESPAKPTGKKMIDAEADLSRRSAIRTSFKPWGESHRELMDACLDDFDCSPVDAKLKLLAAAGNSVSPISGSSVIAGLDAGEKFRAGAVQALEARSSLAKHDPQNELNGYSLRELARMCLSRSGRPILGDPMAMVGAAFTTTSDFPAIMENVLNKAMLKGFEDAPETFQLFTSVGSLSDFKQGSRVGMSEFSDLDVLPEHGEYKAGKFTDKKETVQLATYGKVFNLTRQAIINDDLGALVRVPAGMGRAAKRKIGNLVYSILTGGQVMTEDGVQLFSTATHANYVEGAGTTLTAANLDIARTAMARQKDLQGIANLNITPMFLIVPVTLLGTAKRLMVSETDPTQANSKLPNIVQGMATVIADARLDAVSTTAWYLLASPALFDTIEVQYLNGVQTPFMEQQTAWNVDGTSWKVRIDAAARALEWRTQYKSKGAA